MELRGVDENGKPVKTSLSDLAEKLRKGGEELSFGRSPTTVVYHNRATNQKREVDLQEVSQASGIRNVQFHFDPAAAKSAGLIVDADVDQGVAYNLERIKKDEHKLEYLESKGFQNVMRYGDDFYQYEAGKLKPINNKDGLDWSDITRMGAHAGRDLGASTAATVMVGGSAVATGGLGVAGGMAMAGTAGALGGVAGEAGQRVLDQVVGNDAEQYNRRLDTSEEALNYAKDAGMGFIGGALQPAMAAGGAAIKNAVAPVLEKTGEWGAKRAAIMQGNALATRLPQGWMQQYGTMEEAKAATELAKGIAMTKGGGMAGAEMKAVVSETKDAIAQGSLKAGAATIADDPAQAALRQQFQSQTLAAAQTRELAKAGEADAAREAAARAAANLTKLREKAETTFASHKKDLEVIFNPESDLQASVAAQTKIEDNVAKIFTGKGVKFDYDLDGRIVGVESESYSKVVEKTSATVFEKSRGYLDGLRTGEAFLQRAPSDQVKGSTTNAIKTVMGDVDAGAMNGEIRGTVKELISAIDSHGPTGGNKGIRDVVSRFQEVAYAAVDNPTVPEKTQRALLSINNQLRKYEIASSPSRDLVTSYYNGMNKLLELKRINFQQRGAQTPEAFENFVRGLHGLSQATGDHGAELVRPLVNASHLDTVFKGEAERGLKPFYDLLGAETREKMDALMFLRQVSHHGKKVIPSDTKDKKNAAAAIVGGIAAAMKGESILGGAAMGYATGQFIPAAGVAALAKGAAGAVKSGTTKAAGVAKTVAGAASDALDSGLSKIGLNSARRKQIGKGAATMESEEELIRRAKAKRLKEAKK